MAGCVIEEFQVHMGTLNCDRMVRVCLPVGYEQGIESYPVLFMHDGQNLYRDEDASYGMCWGIKDELERTARPLIVVGIDCAQGTERLNEYGPWVNPEIGQSYFQKDEPFGGKGAQYIEFIVNELKPMIDAKYRTKPDETAMAGSSMGGLISTYAACKYPNLFRRIASVSSAYWFNQKEIEAYIEVADLSAVEKFYMDVGTKEGGEEEHYRMYVESSQSVYKKLKEKVSDCRFEIIDEGIHNERAWSIRVPEIFGYLFGTV